MNFPRTRSELRVKVHRIHCCIDDGDADTAVPHFDQVANGANEPPHQRDTLLVTHTRVTDYDSDGIGVG
jgi:hypothetical protein